MNIERANKNIHKQIIINAQIVLFGNIHALSTLYYISWTLAKYANALIYYARKIHISGNIHKVIK